MSRLFDGRPVPPGGPLYWLIHSSTWAAGALLTHTRVLGAERVPRHGGIIIVSNHSSVADPLVVVGSTPRPVTYMAKEELFAGWYARLAARLSGGAFPVRRGQNDIRAVRAALDLIRCGAAVAMFPEGTRHPEGLGAALPGVSYLASRADCPVVPVAIIGTQHIRSIAALARRPAIEVRFGESFSVGRSADAVGVAAEIMRRIADLLPPDRRGIYTENPREAIHAS